jgi:hypothetical protein
MKNFGFLFTLAFVAQGVLADNSGIQYSNLAVAVGEASASASWAVDFGKVSTPVSETHRIEAEQLKEMTEQTKSDVNFQLQKRISDMIEKSLQPVDL